MLVEVVVVVVRVLTVTLGAVITEVTLVVKTRFRVLVGVVHVVVDTRVRVERLRLTEVEVKVV